MTRPGDIQREPDKNTEEVLEELGESGNLSSMEELEKIIDRIIATLPRLDRFKLRKEMENMNVILKQNPMTKDLSEGLAYAQGYKSRLSEIYNLALREFRTRSRCVDMLFDAYNAISTGKSADVRRGQATMKYPMLLIQLEGAETFLKEVEHVLQNVKSAMDAISRQVSVMQIEVSIGEVRREAPNSNGNRYEAEEIRSNNGPKELGWGDV